MRRLLHKLGFRVMKRRSHEINLLFDRPKDSLGRQGKLIRLRRVGRDALLTYKGPSSNARYKKRHELETMVSDPDILEEIFKQIGYRTVYRYEKFRTEYARPQDAGKVLLDETPAGNFLELEGSPRWIDRTARLLGFCSADYITGSYGYLHMLYCRERGTEPGDMLFPPKRNARASKGKQP